MDEQTFFDDLEEQQVDFISYEGLPDGSVRAYVKSEYINYYHDQLKGEKWHQRQL